jgi:hypothetical protein
MYIAPEQVRESLRHLQWVHPFYGIAFLSFKRIGLPVGVRDYVVVSRCVDEVMQRHFKPSAEFSGYYQPFSSSDPNDRWVSPRYASTSLQRIIADTFGDAFLHEKGSQDWGWKTDYVERLKERLNGELIPAFHLGVWLFRDLEWGPNPDPDDVVLQFLETYGITTEEAAALFDMTAAPVGEFWVRDVPTSEAELLDMIGPPPGTKPARGALLHALSFAEVGPSRGLTYEPSDRLNVITGNNSLGKTFLLDLIWWALTGTWAGLTAEPQRLAHSSPKIRTVLRTGSSRLHETTYSYSRHLEWTSRSKSEVRGGLVVYARYDGSFAIWDASRVELLKTENNEAPEWVFLTRENVWNGLSVSTRQRSVSVCNGLMNDWLLWQTGGSRFADTFETFCFALSALSPDLHDQPLAPGEPTRIGIDTRELPTLRMPYGEVPLIHASAGVKRIVALAYMLVWTWHEHLRASALIGQKPQRRLVIIIDEIEAHLHPLWQRLIVRSLMEVVRLLSNEVDAQLHIATHSPLVLASVEPFFEPERDGLHHLRLAGSDVRMEGLPFVKRGTADLWLMSDAFGLEQARSSEAEQAIEDATALQLEDEPSPSQVREVNQRLVRLLAHDDEFWPMWRYFAKIKGDIK